MRIHIGCCGWNYLRPEDVGEDRNWKQRYPHKLALYAAYFDLVEVNSTFYRLPQVKTAARWFELARAVNSRFEFTVKANQEITHRDRFASERSLAAYERTAAIADALDAKVILFQTPRSFHPTEENIARLRRFFTAIDRHGQRFAFEPRGWDDESVQAVLDLDLIHVTDPFARLPLTKNTAYLRLHGAPPGDRMYRYDYTPTDLRRLAELISSLAADEVYLLFNNDHMYQNARTYITRFTS